MKIFPVRLPSWSLCLLLAGFLCGAALPATAAEPELGTIRGRLQVPEQVPCRGTVSLWDGSDERLPDPRRYLIIPFGASNLPASCEFELRAPAGVYYVGAIVRQSSGPELGPPRVGDLVFMTPDAKGGAVRVELAAGETVDLGIQSSPWVYAGMESPTRLGLTGRVHDPDGQPVPGVLVVAFADADLSGRPLAISERTDSQGSYVLRLDRPGEVYLRVKDDYGGGAPREGSHIGVYGGANPEAVTVSTTAVIENLDIAVFRVPTGRDPARAAAGEGPMPPDFQGK